MEIKFCPRVPTPTGKRLTLALKSLPRGVEGLVFTPHSRPRGVVEETKTRIALTLICEAVGQSKGFKQRGFINTRRKLCEGETETDKEQWQT